MSDYLDSSNEELLKDYFSEAEQMIDNLESNILAIESDPSNHDAIDEIFRAAHTLKGNSAAVEFTEVAHFAHTMEDLLDEVRSDKVKVNEDIIDVLLNAAFIPGKGGAAPSPAPAPKPAAPKPAAAPAAAAKVELSEYELEELKQNCGGGEKLWQVKVVFDENNPMNSVGGIQVFAALKSCGTVLKTIPDFDALYEDKFYKDVTYFVSTAASGEELEDTAFPRMRLLHLRRWFPRPPLLRPQNLLLYRWLLLRPLRSQ